MKKGPLSFGFNLNVTNIVIALLAIVLNIAELIIIISKKQIKPFERVLLSLCVADILISIVYVVESFHNSETKTKLFRQHDYLISHIIEYICLLSSIANIIALGVDRLLAVKYPLKHKIWMTKRRVNLLIIVAWVSSIALSLICSTENFIYGRPRSRSPVYTFAALSFAFGMIITGLYAAIIKTMIDRRKTLANVPTQRNVRADESAVTITCVNVVIAFSICTYPFLIDLIVDPRPSLPFKFILLNSLLDPIVYYFRSYLKKVFYKRSKRSVPGNLDSRQTQSSPGCPDKQEHSAV